jgi:hypothetical protein
MLKYQLYLLVFLPLFMNWTGSVIVVKPAGDHPDFYTALHLQETGLTNETFQLAIKGYNKLKNEGRLRNPGILTIADFSQSSKCKRLYVIDLAHNVLLFNTYVAHGRNTGSMYARHFSNDPGSNKSSLGFYITKEEIMGSRVGISLVLDGVEKGFNDNAQKREIIMHGADYATENTILKTGRLGRSFGCPALPPDQINSVIETIKDGTCLFIYQHNDQYLCHSRLLN